MGRKATKPAAIVTPEYMQGMIDKCIADGNREKLAHFIGRCLVILYNNQTAGEQISDATNTENGKGFTKSDARGGCKTAKSYIHGVSYREIPLLDWQMAKWTKRNAKGVSRIVKYHRQINEAALIKQREKENENAEA